MRKTCVQAEGEVRINSTERGDLSTAEDTITYHAWTNQQVSPCPAHNFMVQICTPKLSNLTAVEGTFSPSSTGLIINTNSETRILFIGNGG